MKYNQLPHVLAHNKKQAAKHEGETIASLRVDNATLRAQNAELREALEIALHRADQARYHTAEAIQPITAEWLDGIITEARRVLEETNAK